MKYALSIIFWLNWFALTWLILYGETPDNVIGTVIAWAGFLMLAFTFTPKEIYSGKGKDDKQDG